MDDVTSMTLLPPAIPANRLGEDSPTGYTEQEMDTVSDSTAVALGAEASDSHALAQEDHEEKGAVQEAERRFRGDDKVTNLGWGEAEEDVPNPLIGGMENEELWLLIRRFNKQMQYVKALSKPPAGGLDLQIADEEAFSPEKLRANVERFYTTAIIGLTNFLKHITRIQSWNEPKRTSLFAIVYFTAWTFDCLALLFIALLITLIIYPPSRTTLFPPLPPALINTQTGALQKPPARALGSGDSLTGAGELHKGEAVEQEASNFVSSFVAIAVKTTAGAQESNRQQEDKGVLDNLTPDPGDVAGIVDGAQGVADGAGAGVGVGGEKGSVKKKAMEDKTREPVEEMMWARMRPGMHVLGDITDTWERIANALSPTPPFPLHSTRLKLSFHLSLIIYTLTILIPPALIIKSLNFTLGTTLFFLPLLRRLYASLNHRFPHWRKYFELRNTLLRGVPTNAQLTITLLRIGEARGAPVPPPPRRKKKGRRDGDGDGEEKRMVDEEAEVGLKRVEEREGALPSDGDVDDHEEDGGDDDGSGSEGEHGGIHHADESNKKRQKGKKKKKSKKKKHRLLSFIKGTTKAGVGTILKTDEVKAKMGSGTAKNRLGLIKEAVGQSPRGPVEFTARWEGRRGRIVLLGGSGGVAGGGGGGGGGGGMGGSPTKRGYDLSGPILCFTTTFRLKSLSLSDPNSTDVDVDVNDPGLLWTLPIHTIREIRKISGLGWKGKLVVGWSMGRTIADGIEIVDMDGREWRCTAMELRDELFNRLIAICPQVWEAW